MELLATHALTFNEASTTPIYYCMILIVTIILYDYIMTIVLVMHCIQDYHYVLHVKVLYYMPIVYCVLYLYGIQDEYLQIHYTIYIQHP